jgi:hypothetical protein
MILHPKVIEELGGQKVLGFVRGFGLRSLTPTFVVTENGILIYDPKLTGAIKTNIPFAQILGASYWLEMGVPYISVSTQSGTTKLMLSGSKKDTHEPALRVFQLLRNKFSELAGVPISESHNKGIMKEIWSFYAPPQLAVMGSKSQESKATESITEQIKELADLRDAGILTQEEFENKKKELLARL